MKKIKPTDFVDVTVIDDNFTELDTNLTEFKEMSQASIKAQMRSVTTSMLQLGSHTLDISLPSTGWTDHPDEARYKHRQKIVTDVDLWESSWDYQYLLTGGVPYTSVGDITDEQVEEYLSGVTVLLDVYYDAESMSEAEDCGLTKVEVTREGRLMAVTFHAEAKPAGNLSAKTWYKIHMEDTV